jgi:hypothetical protein
MQMRTALRPRTVAESEGPDQTRGRETRRFGKHVAHAQPRPSDAAPRRLTGGISGRAQVVYVQFNYVAPGKTAAALETELARPVLGDRKLVMRFQTKLY